MIAMTGVLKALSVACMILAIGVSSHCGPLESGQNTGNRQTSSKGNNDTLYSLDRNNPSIQQTIDASDIEVRDAKFVEIEVPEVVNPAKHALIFQVHYQPASGTKILLGSFSLFPADNPGKFIVPTRGEVKPSGTIVLSMTLPGKAEPGDPVRVRVKRLRFTKG